jgi:hypothetical protein
MHKKLMLVVSNPWGRGTPLGAGSPKSLGDLLQKKEIADFF